MFESKLENIYDMKSLNYINLIHDKDINNIVEWNLLQCILNYSKLTKYINIHYYPIQYGCMNTRKGKAKFKIFKYYWIVDVVPNL